MSLPTSASFFCPECGNKIEIRAWNSINTQYPNVAKKLMSRELFAFTCPRCKYHDYVEYELLYNDMNHDMMIQVMHNTTGREDAIDALAKMVSIGDSSLRIVHNSLELSEKVTALECGRDDRIIEICKYVSLALGVQKSIPDFELKRALYYQNTDSGQEQFSFYGTKGEHFISPFDDNLETLYEKLSHFCTPILDREYSTHYIFDYAWAEEFLAEHENIFSSESEDSAFLNLPEWQQELVDRVTEENDLSDDERSAFVRALEIEKESEEDEKYLSFRESLSQVETERRMHIPSASIHEQLAFIREMAKQGEQTINEVIDQTRANYLLNKYFDEGNEKNDKEVEFLIWRERVTKTANKTPVQNYVTLMGRLPEPPFFPKSGDFNYRFILDFGQSQHSGLSNSIMCFYNNKILGDVGDAYVEDDTVVVQGYLANMEYENEDGETVQELSLICETFERFANDQ